MTWHKQHSVQDLMLRFVNDECCVFIVMLSVVMLSVVAPSRQYTFKLLPSTLFNCLKLPRLEPTLISLTQYC